jgi:hypothetical protein
MGRGMFLDGRMDLAAHFDFLWNADKYFCIAFWYGAELDDRKPRGFG